MTHRCVVCNSELVRKSDWVVQCRCGAEYGGIFMPDNHGQIEIQPLAVEHRRETLTPLRADYEVTVPMWGKVCGR